MSTLVEANIAAMRILSSHARGEPTNEALAALVASGGLERLLACSQLIEWASQPFDISGAFHACARNVVTGEGAETTGIGVTFLCDKSEMQLNDAWACNCLFVEAFEIHDSTQSCRRCGRRRLDGDPLDYIESAPA